ncbi:UNVERIFIED_CONTAM: hypothetical protein FKN15_046426 [Acipenser sinensis]
MIPKSMAVEFTYQPGESSSEDEDLDATERKAAEVLDFLQATQEIYFADRELLSFLFLFLFMFDIAST